MLDYLDEPQAIFKMKEKEILLLTKALRQPRKIKIPEEFLSNEIYSPTSFHLTFTPCKESKKTSQGEKECRRVLEGLYLQPFHRARPNFLKSSETQHNLELDLFNATLGIACEYHGKQHYVFPHRYCKKKALFLDKLKRDIYKMLLCRQLGIYLIIVPYTIRIEDIGQYIRERLPL